MRWGSLGALALAASGAHALLRFSCSQLVVERLDPQVILAPDPTAAL